MFAVVPAVGIVCLLSAELTSADFGAVKRFRGAALPTFSPADGAGIFFADVFSQGVAGPRPTGPLRLPVPDRAFHRVP